MPTETISIPREEYRHLIQVQRCFERLQTTLMNNLFLEPSTRSARSVIADLKASKKHSPAALRGLAAGLKASKYFSA